MNVAKRLNKLEALLGNDEHESNVLIVQFVKLGELDKRITHLWSKEGVDDCYMFENETDDDFLHRASKHIRKLNDMQENEVLMAFGNSEMMQITA